MSIINVLAHIYAHELTQLAFKVGQFTLARRSMGCNRFMKMTKYLLEPKMRIELTTYALRVRCSTPELPGRVFS